MTPNQKAWSEARERMADALAAIGFPRELADLLAKQLKSPRAMERMTAYLYAARPRSVEMIVDEMMAICDDQAAWREKKESQAAQAGYSAWLNSENRRRSTEEE